MCRFVSVLLPDIFYSVGLGCLVVVLFIMKSNLSSLFSVVRSYKLSASCVSAFTCISDTPTTPQRRSACPAAFSLLFISAAAPRHVQNGAD